MRIINSRLGAFIMLLLVLLFVWQACQVTQKTGQNPQTLTGVNQKSVSNTETFEGNGLPSLSPVTAGNITAGSQWKLVDVWNDYVSRNIEGIEYGIDWGFFEETGVQNPRKIQSECMDPTVKNPGIGDIYTVDAGDPSMLLPSRAGTQRFRILNLVSENGSVQATIPVNTTVATVIETATAYTDNQPLLASTPFANQSTKRSTLETFRSLTPREQLISIVAGLVLLLLLIIGMMFFLLPGGR